MSSRGSGHNSYLLHLVSGWPDLCNGDMSIFPKFEYGPRIVADRESHVKGSHLKKCASRHGLFFYVTAQETAMW